MSFKNKTIHTAILLATSSSFIQANAGEFGSDELIQAAKKEGRVMLYTTLDTQNTRSSIAAFNKHFPEINVDILRVPGGQLVTRVQTEAATDNLAADVIVFSDPVQAQATEEVFADYQPTNAAQYPNKPGQKTWPYALVAWCIGYNSALVKNPPTTWADLAKEEYKNVLGEVTVLAGGSGISRVMFEQEVLGDDYWTAIAKNKPKIYPSGVPMSDALVRGEIQVAPILTNQILVKTAQGAPVNCSLASEGVPSAPLPSGVTQTSKAPNAARLFMNWLLSKEGQHQVVDEFKMASAMEGMPAPDIPGSETAKVWSPDLLSDTAARAQLTKKWLGIFQTKN